MPGPVIRRDTRFPLRSSATGSSSSLEATRIAGRFQVRMVMSPELACTCSRSDRVTARVVAGPCTRAARAARVARNTAGILSARGGHQGRRLAEQIQLVLQGLREVLVEICARRIGSEGALGLRQRR